MDFNTLEERETAVTDSKNFLDTLIAEKQLDPSSVSNSEIRKAENELKKNEKALEKYKSGVSDKVTVTAYLSKNKKTTTTNKSFTITKSGLN